MAQRALAGSGFYAGSRRLPADLFDLSPPPLTAAQCDALAARLAGHDLLSAAPTDAPDDPTLRFFELLCGVHRGLLQQARFFVPDEVELIEYRREQRALRVAVPAVHFQPGLSSALFRNLANGLGRSAREDSSLDDWLTRLRGQLADRDRPSVNTFSFVGTAFELGMPVIELPARQMQIGHGNRAAVFKGSITHRTSSIGVSMAKQKPVCNALLAQAGFPIADGWQVANLEQARRRADELGYPVVVKPADLDGGEAVSCDIRSEEELEQGFRLARAASPNVIVEKHIVGRDFRLLFYNDELLARIERFPGGVTGNGVDSIAQLLERMNADPTRHRGRDAFRYPLDFDDEARLMLRRRGMSAESVPADGEFVQLRRAANFALGGTVARVEQEIHPDNIDLCRRAMRLLRLDLAGLDLILPDIAQSWREGGGVICEVNAQPFIGTVLSRNVYTEILPGLVTGDGRIPLVLVIGALDEAAVETIVARVPQLAVIDGDGARLGRHPLTVRGTPWLQACQAALLDPQVAAALCILDPARHPVIPSPVDRFSAAYLLDGLPGDDADLPQHLAAMLARAGGNLAAAAEYGPALKRAGLSHRVIEAGGLIDELVEALG
jgi:cyanophycin synthetase